MCRFLAFPRLFPLRAFQSNGKCLYFGVIICMFSVYFLCMFFVRFLAVSCFRSGNRKGEAVLTSPIIAFLLSDFKIFHIPFAVRRYYTAFRFNVGVSKLSSVSAAASSADRIACAYILPVVVVSA